MFTLTLRNVNLLFSFFIGKCGCEIGGCGIGSNEVSIAFYVESKKVCLLVIFIVLYIAHFRI